MKFLPRGLDLEKFYADKGLRAVERFRYRDFDVYIAEGGPHYDNAAEFPMGYYESAYAIGQDGKVLYFQPMAFSFDHDLSYTEEARQKLRINSARVEAREHLDRRDAVEKGTAGPSSRVIGMN